MKNLPSKKQLFFQGAKACLPIIPGYWAVAITCGAIGPVCGFSFWQVEAMAIFLYAGSAQLVFCSLVASQATFLQLIIAVALINMRYLFMGTYIAKFFKHITFFKKFINSGLITDETFGVATQYAKTHNDKLPFYWLLGLNIAAWINWVAANTVGALIGSVIPAWANDALNFSLVGMFIGILVLTLRTSRHAKNDYFVFVVAIISTIILHQYIDKQIAIIIAALFSAICGALFYKKRKVVM